jgi:hypothetical protein
MPLVEGEKLANVYKKIDDKSNMTSYFRELYQRTKKKKTYAKVYAIGFYMLLPTVIVMGIFLSDTSLIDQSQEQSLSEVIIHW